MTHDDAAENQQCSLTLRFRQQIAKLIVRGSRDENSARGGTGTGLSLNMGRLLGPIVDELATILLAAVSQRARLLAAWSIPVKGKERG